MERAWPNFFIVGAARSGTTSMYEYLKRIPGIYMSPVKEPHFFLTEVGPQAGHLYHIESEEQYLSLFRPKSNENILGEASPSYLWDPESAAKISHKAGKHAKILIILRDPIKRAYSHFLYHLRFGFETAFDFKTAVEKDFYSNGKKGWGYSHLYVELGMYSDQVRRYFNSFDQDSVKVIGFEDDLMSKTRETVQDMVAFLGLRYEVPAALVQTRYNTAAESFALPRSGLSHRLSKSIGRWRKNNLFLSTLLQPLASVVGESLFVRHTEKPPLTKEAESFLKEIYSDNVYRLGTLLSRPPNWISNY